MASEDSSECEVQSLISGSWFIFIVPWIWVVMRAVWLKEQFDRSFRFASILVLSERRERESSGRGSDNESGPLVEASRSCVDAVDEKYDLVDVPLVE